MFNNIYFERNAFQCNWILVHICFKIFATFNKYLLNVPKHVDLSIYHHLAKLTVFDKWILRDDSNFIWKFLKM